MRTQWLLALAIVFQLVSSGSGQEPKTSPQPSATPGSSTQQSSTRPSATPQQSPIPQQPAQAAEEDVVRINTNLVQVDAVITDKSGKLVTDLRPEEVQIFEDGRSQKITHFSFIDKLFQGTPHKVSAFKRQPEIVNDDRDRATNFFGA